MDSELEVIDAFIDGERVDSTALKTVLASETGRDYFVDAWMLREAVQQENEAGATSATARTPASTRPSAPARTVGRWLVPVALAAGVAGGYFAGYRQTGVTQIVTSPPAATAVASAPTPVFPVPTPTRVIQLEFRTIPQTPTSLVEIDVIPTLLLSTILVQSAAGAPTQAPATPPAATAAGPELLVVVVVPVYQPDGAVSAETIGLPPAGGGLVHVFSRRTVCEPATAGAAEPKDAAFGWRVASQIVARTDRDVVVSMDWRRLWDAGKKVANGPGGSVQLTLHPGDRIPLDHIPNASPRPDCRAVGLGLEVRLARSAQVSAPSPTMLPLGATPGGAKSLDAELWLTHTLPTGTEQVLHQKVRVEPKGGKFGFAPTSFSTSRGDISVELTGLIDRYRTPAGGEFIVLSMNRVVSGANLPAAGLSATTGTVVPLPEAGDVLSFEMPGAVATGRARSGGAMGAGGARGGGNNAAAGGAGGGATAGGAQAAGARSAGARGGGGMTAVAGGRGGGAQLAALLEGHQFSLRLRVTPIN